MTQSNNDTSCRITCFYLEKILGSPLFGEPLNFTTPHEISLAFNKLKKYNAQLVLYYNLSILQGEYYNHTEAEKILSKITDKIKRLIENILSANKTVQIQQDNLKSIIKKLTFEQNEIIRKSTSVEEYELNKVKFDELEFELEVTREKYEAWIRTGENILSVEVYFKYHQRYNRHYNYLVNRIKDRLFLEDRNKISTDNEADHLLATVWEEIEDGKQVSFSTDITLIPRRYFYLFLINIKLAEVDEGYGGYKADRETIEKLIYYIELLKGYDDAFFITSYSSKIAHKLLINKCNYLLLKIFIRLAKDKEKKQYDKHYYNKEYVITTISDEFKFSFNSLNKAEELGPFETFNKASRQHYIDKKFSFPDVVESIIQIINQPSGSTILIENIHFICKVVKISFDEIVNKESPLTLKKTIEYLKEIKERFIKQYEEYKDDKKDVYAYESAVHLISATIYKLQLANQRRNFQFNDIDDILRELKQSENYLSKAKDYSIKSLTIIHKSIECIQIHRDFIEFIEFLLGKIKIILENDELKIGKEFYEKYQKIINRYYTQVAALDSIIKDAEKENYLPLYLLVQECFVKVKASGIVPEEVKPKESLVELNEESRTEDFELCIFLDSGYILPSDYNFLKNESLLSKQRIKLLENQIVTRLARIEVLSQRSEMRKTFDAKAIEFREKLTADFEDKVKQSQSTAIQLIGFFIGVITFILTTITVIPKFKGGNTVGIIFAFLLFVGGILSFFTLVLSYITRHYPSSISISPKEKKNILMTIKERSVAMEIWENTRARVVTVMSIAMMILGYIGIYLINNSNISIVEEQNNATTQVNNNNEISVVKDTCCGNTPSSTVKYIYVDSTIRQRTKKCVWDCDSVYKYKVIADSVK